MKRLAILPFLFLLTLLVGPTDAQAGEAIEELKGAWVAESFDGEALPPGMSITMTFVDDSTLKLKMSFNGESEEEEFKYKADKDGNITVYDEPEENPEGEKAKWEVKADKKLYIKGEEGETMILKRPA